MKSSFSKITIFFVIASSFVLFSCTKPDISKRSVEMITEKRQSSTIFNSLTKLVDSVIVSNELNDSLAFLILPIQASCPSCRKKTIDSILKHRDNLMERHFIIINFNGGKREIDVYFRERHGEIPMIENRLILDSTNLSQRFDLCKDRPTIYYTYNRKAYKKVSAIPLTVRDDLKEFFSGSRY